MEIEKKIVNDNLFRSMIYGKRNSIQKFENVKLFDVRITDILYTSLLFDNCVFENCSLTSSFQNNFYVTEDCDMSGLFDSSKTRKHVRRVDTDEVGFKAVEFMDKTTGARTPAYAKLIIPKGALVIASLNSRKRRSTRVIVESIVSAIDGKKIDSAYSMFIRKERFNKDFRYVPGQEVRAKAECIGWQEKPYFSISEDECSEGIHFFDGLDGFNKEGIMLFDYFMYGCLMPRILATSELFY